MNAPRPAPPSTGFSLALALTLVVLPLLTACGKRSDAAPEHPRARLFAAGGGDPVQRLLTRDPARLTVVYWPAVGACLPRERTMLESVQRVAADHRDIRFLSVIPDDPRVPEERYGQGFPGELVRLPPDVYLHQDRLGPRPRLEVWSARGELLLLKSIPPVARQAERLADEIVWSLAFTEPVADATAESGG